MAYLNFGSTSGDNYWECTATREPQQEVSVYEKLISRAFFGSERGIGG